MELPLGSNSHGTCQGNFFPLMCSNGELVTQLSKLWVRLAWISFWKAFLLTTWHELMDENINNKQSAASGVLDRSRFRDAMTASSGKVLSQETSQEHVYGINLGMDTRHYQAFSTPKRLAFTSCWEKCWVNFARRRRNAKSCGLQKVKKNSYGN